MTFALPIVATLMQAVAIAWLARGVVSVVLADRGDDLRGDIYETARRRRLRAASPIYACFEPVVDRYAARISRRWRERVADLESSLRVLDGISGMSGPDGLAVVRFRTAAELLVFTVAFDLALPIARSIWIALPIIATGGMVRYTQLRCRQRLRWATASVVEWRGAEWLAVARLGVLLDLFTLGVPWWMAFSAAGMTWLAAASYGVLALALFELSYRRVAACATETRCKIVQEIPFSVDLIILALRAGSTFTQAIETLVGRLERSPWTIHLERMLNDIRLGLPRLNALSSLAARLNIPSVDQIVFSIRQGEALGTPLADILAAQGHHIRTGRYQDIEAAAEKARVRLVLPATLSMLAGFLTMLAPLLLSVGQELSGLGGR